MVRHGRVKENVAGERYDSNALQMEPSGRPGSVRSRPQQQSNPMDLMSSMGGMGGMGGGMPDMSQMMEMMQSMGGMPGMPGMGGMPGMPGMGGPMAGMMPPMMPVRPKILYPYGLVEGAPVDRFCCFYPNYIDSKKTVQEGRRIPKEHACETPIADEMSEVCTYLKLPHALEPGKRYPRDWMVAGRIKVRFQKPDGSPENPDVQTRKQLMLKMSELIPKLQSRKTRLENEALAAKQAATGAGAASTTAVSKKKGKGKKGRR